MTGDSCEADHRCAYPLGRSPIEPIVGFALLGKLVRVLGGGGTEPFGDLSSFGTTAMTFTTGLALDTSNDVYAAPGIYELPAAGGDGVRFDTAADGA